LKHHFVIKSPKESCGMFENLYHITMKSYLVQTLEKKISQGFQNLNDLTKRALISNFKNKSKKRF
jgi:hypothetical protein